MQKTFFLGGGRGGRVSKFDIQSAGVTLKMRQRSPKSNHFSPCPSGVAMQVMQGHQNLSESLNHPHVTIYEVWPESVI